VYLAEPAPAGSYTAYLYGAPAGLSAGYHLYHTTDISWLHPTERVPEECYSSVEKQALVEFQKRYGDQYNVSAFPFLRSRDESGVVPDDVYDAMRQIIGRLQMQECEIPEREEVAPSDLDISLDVSTIDPNFTQGSKLSSK
jgi:hypothetical protein